MVWVKTGVDTVESKPNVEVTII